MSINSPGESPRSKQQIAQQAYTEYKQKFGLNPGCTHEELMATLTAILKDGLAKKGIQKTDTEIREMAENHRILWQADRESQLLGYDVI